MVVLCCLPADYEVHRHDYALKAEPLGRNHEKRVSGLGENARQVLK